MNFFYRIKNKKILYLLFIIIIGINIFVLKPHLRCCINNFASRFRLPPNELLLTEQLPPIEDGRLEASKMLLKTDAITEIDSIGAISVEYFEDTKGDLTFEQIKSEKFKNSFEGHKDSTISIGYSRSNWWFRIRVKNLHDFSESKYFSINNPDIEKITLYLPQIVNGQETYCIMKSGSEYKNEVNDIGFIYPVFKISNDTNFEKYIYIQIRSLYTQNYEFKIVDNEEFDKLRQISLLCIGIFFGTLIAMLLYNFMIFIFLRDKVYLYYVIYIFTMILYQLGLTGTVKVFRCQSAYLLEQYFGMVGFFMIVAAIVFIREFLKTHKNVPWHDKFLKISLGLIVIDIIMMLLGYKYIALVTSIFIVNVVLLLVLSTSIFCLYRKVRQARYFLLAWSVMIIGSMICILRGLGFAPQNLLTMNFILAAASIESILLSVALVDRIKFLREEKENAERTSKFNEIAFLKAQIKPHFLYNALNVIAALCRIEPEKARELILDLSNYLRHTFDVSNKSEYITFNEEFEFIEAYVRIQKARFREKLKVEYEIEDTTELMIPALILQPLVENAIKHGIRKKEYGGTVILRVKNEKKCFIIEVEDNGVGMSTEEVQKIQNSNFEKGKGIGIVNIRLRLKEIYGTDLRIESEMGKGTLVSFKVPKT